MAILDKLRCPEKFLAIQAAIRYNLSFCRTPKILADGKSDSSGSEIVPNCKRSASWGALKASKIRNQKLTAQAVWRGKSNRDF
jgi:hypothetical protein